MGTALNQDKSKQGEIYQGFQANLKPAPYGKRFLAFCVDYGILGAAMYLYIILAVFVFAFAGISLGSLKGSGAISIVYITLLVLLILGGLAMYHAYFIYFEYKKGRTPGKKLFGLSVVTDDGSPRTLSKIIIRELFRYVDNLMVPALICMAVTDRQQRIGDLMAGVFVAHSKTQESGSNFLYIKQEDFNYLYELVQPSPQIDPKFMDDFMQFASQKFLKGISDFDMKDSHMMALEQEVRLYFQNESHKRLDGRSALLFFAEHCYQLDLKKRLEEKG